LRRIACPVWFSGCAYYNPSSPKHAVRWRTQRRSVCLKASLKTVVPAQALRPAHIFETFNKIKDLQQSF
jgi:hypothetical protein